MGVVLVKDGLHFLPHVLDWVQVGAVRRPIYRPDSMRLGPILGGSRSVNPGIILLEEGPRPIVWEGLSLSVQDISQLHLLLDMLSALRVVVVHLLLSHLVVSLGELM